MYIAQQGPAAAASSASNAPPAMASTNPRMSGLGGNSTLWLVVIAAVVLGYAVFSVRIGKWGRTMPVAMKVVTITAVLIGLYLVLTNFLGSEGVINASASGYTSAVRSLQGR
jgi:hypothetical protein